MLKAVFGVLSLLLVLAIVGSVAKRQLQAVSGAPSARAAAASTGGGTVPGGLAGAVATDPAARSVPAQARTLQEQTRSATTDALQQGMRRNDRAEP